MFCLNGGTVKISRLPVYTNQPKPVCVGREDAEDAETTLHDEKLFTETRPGAVGI